MDKDPAAKTSCRFRQVGFELALSFSTLIRSQKKSSSADRVSGGRDLELVKLKL